MLNNLLKTTAVCFLRGIFNSLLCPSSFLLQALAFVAADNGGKAQYFYCADSSSPFL
jgi:hypothetical protein